MDVLQEKMQNTDFVWAYRNDISFEGKDENGYYTVCVNGLENDDYDIACYSFKDYEKLKNLFLHCLEKLIMTSYVKCMRSMVMKHSK